MVYVSPSTHEVLEDWEAEGVADQMLSDIYGTVTIDGLIDSMELVYE